MICSLYVARKVVHGCENVESYSSRLYLKKAFIYRHWVSKILDRSKWDKMFYFFFFKFMCSEVCFYDCYLTWIADGSTDIVIYLTLHKFLSQKLNILYHEINVQWNCFSHISSMWLQHFFFLCVVAKSSLIATLLILMKHLVFADLCLMSV